MSTIDNHDPVFHTPPISKGYALSGKIMLSAIIVLFFVVVIMLFLHLYARWYLLRARRRRHRRRRTHLVFYVDSSNTDSVFPFTSQGLDENVLKSIPTFTFSSRPEKEEEKEEECAVCLCEFEEGEKGRKLPKCEHEFHVECIDMWFHSHSTCPLCRVVVELAESTRHEVRVDVNDSDELVPSSPVGLGVKSPTTSRLESLKRMLSREKKPSQAVELCDVESSSSSSSS